MHTIYVRGKDSSSNWGGFSSSSFEITGEGGTIKFTVHLSSGLNLISLPLNATDPTPGHPSHDPGYSAKDLIKDIEDDGGNCTCVSKWEAGGWVNFNWDDEEGDDFSLKLWHGYFIECSWASTWTSEGTLAESEAVPLAAGLNLIGMSNDLEDPTPGHPTHDPSYSAQDLINDINDDGGNCTCISKWEFGGWINFYYDDEEMDDFRMIRGIGYFAECSKASTWIP